jgi:hypothetical protein
MCACSVDIGTCFLVSARQDANQQIQIKSIRDSFLDVDNDPSVRNMLGMSKINFIEDGDKLYIVGNESVTMANIFKRNARRPLSQGVIAPGELEAEKILLVLLENILGRAKVPGEICYFSVPGNPIDRDMNVIYHQAMFSKLIGSLGFKPLPMAESAAIVYSNCAKEMFSGLAISCLTPGQKIITKRGFLNIEDVKDGDEVLSKDGIWQIGIPTSREYSGKIYNIYAYGNGHIELTGNHLIWVGREGKWQWIPAEEVREGDLIMQPWPNYQFDSESKFVCYDERTTCSKEIKNITIGLSSEMLELIGYFLGDGCIEYGNSNTEQGCGVGFTFHKDDTHNIGRISDLVESIFGKTTAEYPHGDNAIRIKFYSKGFSKWLQENCYTDSKIKRVPWEISKLNDSNLRYILKGLFETDGNFKDDHLSFENTSPDLSQFVFLAMHRLGLAPSLHIREPRVGVSPVDDEGRVIIGRKKCYNVQSTGIEAYNFINWMNNPKPSSKKTTIYGSTVAKISSIEVKDYSGPVYDVSIVNGGEPSFCAPGFALHNCGAGMINIALLYQTMIGMNFSITGSGDEIDENSAKATGTNATRTQLIKERGINLLDPMEGDPKNSREREAICIFYKSLILKILDAIKTEFLKRQSSIDLPNAIPLIISGGTSLPKGFKELFEAGFATVKDKFPINISEIRMAKSPLNAVAEGLLVAALNYNEGSHK